MHDLIAEIKLTQFLKQASRFIKEKKLTFESVYSFFKSTRDVLSPNLSPTFHIFLQSTMKINGTSMQGRNESNCFSNILFEL